MPRYFKDKRNILTNGDGITEYPIIREKLTYSHFIQNTTIYLK
jgi:hypothetical protein